ncbi:enniatin synthase, partial [Fusarium heterosporum]
MASVHHADSSLCELVSQSLNLDQDKIESILPGTPFQRDVVDSAADNKQRAIGHVVFDIPSDIDSTRLAAAWKDTVHHTPALRTCTFTSQTGDVYQVVLRDSFVFSWTSGVSLDLREAVVYDEAAAALAGPRCNRFVLLEDPDTKKQQLIWTYSHAVVDEKFQERILRRVLKAYKDASDEHQLLLDTPDSSQATPEEDVQPNPSKMLKIPQAADMQRATQFWRDHLGGLNASAFPHLPSHLATLRPDTKAEHHISYTPAQQRCSSTTLCRTALSILLSRYTNSPEALFGVVTEQAPRFEEQLMLDGPTRTVVPLRVMCAAESVANIITTVDAYDDSVREFAHAGLCNIASTGDDGSAACGFQTVLLVSDGDTQPATTWEILKKTAEPEGFVPCTNRALLLTCQMSRNGARLLARYDQSVIKPQQMTRFLKQLGHLIQHLRAQTDHLSESPVEMVTEEDLAEIETWNSDLIQAQDKLIHREMLKWASCSPDKPAVSAWNGQWSYAELDDVSSRLSQHIRSIDLGREHAIIPIYFEKSKWVVASMLAVLKAGHAFTLIDPNDPPARTRQVVGQTSASIALTSKLHHDIVEATVGRCIIVDDDFVQSLTPASDLPAVQSSDLAYVIFTSGSTGDPKGIMIEHQSFASCATRFGPALGIHSGTRALQFGSHAFGACILEIMTTLIHGGCVCIPSEDDRMNNVPDFINRYSVNWVMATPSYMGTFQPEIVPGLKTLVLVGEQMSASINDIWASRLQLLNGYGQSESSSICCVAKISPGSSEPNNIGRAVGARSWIVDPEDPNRLVPIGAIGELVIESPGIARGYIVAPSLESSPFISTAPAWYPSKQLPHGFKMYRTGDLASYASDGSIVCLGRVDSQVKIRGQRVELGAVETHLRKQMPDDVAIVVEAVKLSDASRTTALTAFLIDPSETEDHILDQTAAKAISTKLEQLVPRHSVPSFYISMACLPRTATGKVDRRVVRIMGSKLLGGHTGVSQPVQTTLESHSDTDAKLESIWHQTLNLVPGSESEQTNFFEMGGNSITAIKMVNMAKSNGFELKVSDIYQNPTLAGLKTIVTGSKISYTPIPKVARNGPTSEQSYAQSRMWFLEQLDKGALWYLNPFAVRMRGHVNVDALTRALFALEQRHETLRTTFENRDGAGVQVVHEKLAKGLRVIDAPEGDTDGLKTLYHQETTGFDLTHEAGWRATLIRLGKDDHILSVIIHHIISDGWSFDVVRRELMQLYAAAIRDQELSSVLSPLPIQYSDFSAWQKQEGQAAEHDRQLQYWKKQLADSAPAKIPTDFPRPALLSGEAGVVPVNIDGGLYQQLQGFCSRHNTTPFSVLLSAFRAAHYRLTAVDDAVIGYPIANRNRKELENMIGFFVNTQCMRIP